MENVLDTSRDSVDTFPVIYVFNRWFSRDHVIVSDVISMVTAFPVMVVFPNPTFEDTIFNRPPLICIVMRMRFYLVEYFLHKHDFRRRRTDFDEIVI